jgi:hypothetical protein
VSYKVLKEKKNTGLVQVYWRKQKTKYKNAVSTFKLNLSKTWEQINVPEIKMILGVELHTNNFDRKLTKIIIDNFSINNLTDC